MDNAFWEEISEERPDGWQASSNNGDSHFEHRPPDFSRQVTDTVGIKIWVYVIVRICVKGLEWTRTVGLSDEDYEASNSSTHNTIYW